MAGPLVFVMHAAIVGAAVAIGFGSFQRNSDGRLIDRRSRLLLLVIVAVGFVSLTSMAVFARMPQLPARYLPIAWWAPIEREYWLPGAVLFFAGASHLASPPNRRALRWLTAAVGVFVIAVTCWRLTTPGMFAFGRTFRDGVCLQSSDYTCGAASLVTLLDRLGVEASEGEMARLTGTVPGRGVTDFQAAHGLQRKLEAAGRSEVARFIVNPDPATVPTPFLASLKHSFWFDHMVCVLDMSEHAAVIGDPLAGRRLMPMDSFRREWRGVAIVAQPPPSNRAE